MTRPPSAPSLDGQPRRLADEVACQRGRRLAAKQRDPPSASPRRIQVLARRPHGRPVASEQHERPARRAEFLRAHGLTRVVAIGKRASARIAPRHLAPIGPGDQIHHPPRLICRISEARPSICTPSSSARTRDSGQPSMAPRNSPEATTSAIRPPRLVSHRSLSSAPLGAATRLSPTDARASSSRSSANSGGVREACALPTRALVSPARV